MVNQEVIDYIKQQLEQGIDKEVVKQTLITNNWQETDVDEAFKIISNPPQEQTTPVLANKKPSSMWKIVVVSLIVITVVGGSIYFISQSLLKTAEAPKVVNEVSNIPVVTTTPLEQPQEQNPEIDFADKLSSCTASKITFKHILTGDILEKEILGIVDEKCNYVEQMPNNGKMECKYSESERMAVAKYYKDMITAESVSTNVQTDTESQQTTYTINDKEVQNPLQEAMESGICVISGYN